MTAAPNELMVERSGETLMLSLNRPEKMNALSASLVEALIAAVDAASGDGTRLLVLRGNGRNLSAGFDFSGCEDAPEGELVLRFIRIEQLLQAIYHAPFETLALAHGKNFGAAVDLVCACNRRVASADASFRMPGLRFGLVLGTRRFAQRVGADRARRVLQVAETFGASEAVAWGFVGAVSEPAQWPDVIAEAERCAHELAPASAAALYAIGTPDHRDADLAALARSAAQPGLKARIAAYRSPR